MCVCSVDARLVGDIPNAGRLEVKYNGTWGAVCGGPLTNRFDDTDARVACFMLGFG